MKHLKWRPLAALAIVALCALPVGAGNQDIQTFVLFAGGDTDSTEQASRWIPIFGAQRVIVRTWSTHLAFATNNADTTKSDSIITFDVLLSDSVSFLGRDSLGTLVTSSSSIPFVSGSHGEPFPVCADSVAIPNAAFLDSIYKGVRVSAPLPINKPLRGAQNGSGILTPIMPVWGQGATALVLDQRATIATRYLRIRCTPLRRLTVSGFSSTAGKRVNGLRGFKMVAYVYTDNK